MFYKRKMLVTQLPDIPFKKKSIEAPFPDALTYDVTVYQYIPMTYPKVVMSDSKV